MKPFKTITLLAVLVFKFILCYAQFNLGLYTGVFTDLSNKNRLKQINVGIEAGITFGNEYELFFQIQSSPPVLKSQFTKQAFTANPSLPLQINVSEKIAPQLFSVALGHKIRITRQKNRSHSLHVLILTGWANQQINPTAKVPQNYALLNAEATQKKSALFAGLGIEWQYKFGKKSRLFAQLCSSNFVFNRNFNLPSAFKLFTPLQLNSGYSFHLHKSKK